MFLPAQLHYPPIHHQTDHFTLGSSGLTLSASVSLTLSPATITGCLDTAVASILSHPASIPSPFQAIVPMKTSQGCLFTAPSGSCHSDYYLFLLGQDPTPLHGKGPGAAALYSIPPSPWLSGLWPLFQFLDGAALSSTGHVWSTLQPLMLPPTHPIKPFSPLLQLKQPFIRKSLLPPLSAPPLHCPGALSHTLRKSCIFSREHLS